jgi:hypothetical protein
LIPVSAERYKLLVKIKGFRFDWQEDKCHKTK